MKHDISVVITAYNEEKKLPDCLDSVSWAREVIVVDGTSTDKTADIAKKHGARVLRRPNNPMLNVNKNFGFSKATSGWILSLDADERVTPDLAREIGQIISSSNTQIRWYWIPRKNIIFGKWIKHGLWWPDKQLRLFRRGEGKFKEKHVHEYITIDGPTADLEEAMVHYNYDHISQFLRKMDTLYTENEVNNLMETGYTFAWYDAIRFPVSDFVKVYFAQKGYKDGLHGLVLALLQAMYSLVVFAKLWERHSFPKEEISLHAANAELARATKDIMYWTATERLSQRPGVLERIRLKLVIWYAVKTGR